MTAPATITVRVQRIVQATAEVKLFELVQVDDAALPPFTPGAHIDVHVGAACVRQYSLCNGPADVTGYLIGVKKEPDSRGGSRTLHETTREGDLLQIGAPRNNFALRDTAGHHVLVAGGIGVTPILSMALHLLASRASFELHYFSRSIALTPFHDVLSAPEYLGRVDFHYALDADAVRAKLRKILWQRKADAHLYLCGPRPFMDAVQQAAAATWPPDAVHLEYFTADAAALAAPTRTFTVRLARSGGEYLVGEDQSIVQALTQYGVHLDTSCEQGVCGTCLTGVIEGEPDHRDSYLSDDEKRCGDRILPCVSRARGAVLVLDI